MAARTGHVVKAAGGIKVLLAAVGAVSVLASCGLPGKIYGSLDWDGSPSQNISSVGGFDALDTVTPGKEYEIQPGTYSYEYSVNYNGHWYPGYDSPPFFPDSSSVVCSGTYTVEAAPGAFPLNGPDHHFSLFLGLDSLGESGDIKSLAPVYGTRSWLQNGLRITVTTSIVTRVPPS